MNLALSVYSLLILCRSPTDAPFSQLSMILLALINAAYLHYQNEKKKKTRAKLLVNYDTSTHSDGGVKAWVDLGDRHPDFKYML